MTREEVKTILDDLLFEKDAKAFQSLLNVVTACAIVWAIVVITILTR